MSSHIKNGISPFYPEHLLPACTFEDHTVADEPKPSSSKHAIQSEDERWEWKKKANKNDI